jgi:DNA-binding CsgD family transcriptional regulator
MSLADARHRPFIDETMQLVRGALGAGQLVFYSVDRDWNLRDFVTQDVPEAMHQSYLRKMVAFDPLHIQRIARHAEPVTRWKDAARGAAPEHVHVFARFLRRYQVVDSLELMFREGATIVAGLNVAWTERDARPTQATVALAGQLQRYIEFTLSSRLASIRSARREAAGAFGLTPREQEVARLVCQGHTNAAVATCLGIQVSTVKTHLLRMFEKCQVDSRAGLVGRLSDPEA